jgi:hypothetical protein
VQARRLLSELLVQMTRNKQLQQQSSAHVQQEDSQR